MTKDSSIVFLALSAMWIGYIIVSLWRVGLYDLIKERTVYQQEQTTGVEVVKNKRNKL